MVDYRLEKLNNENADKWEYFNQHSPEGSFFHSLKWTSIARKESNTSLQYYLLFKNSDIIGLLPFIERKFLFSHGLMPADDPQHIYAIINDDIDSTCLSSIIHDLQNGNPSRKKISFLSISTLHKETLNTITAPSILPWRNVGDMILDLSISPPEEIWNNFSSKRGQRKKIRRFYEHGFKVIEVKSAEELNLFYKYYSDNIDNIKGKLREFSYFNNIWNSLSSDELRITLLLKNSTVAGGKLLLLDKARRTVYSSYLSLNRNLSTTFHPSYFLNWDLVNWAWENNYEKISFGSQDLDENNPRYRIKKDFGANFQPRYWRMITLNSLCALEMKLIDFWIKRSNSHSKKP